MTDVAPRAASPHRRLAQLAMAVAVTVGIGLPTALPAYAANAFPGVGVVDYNDASNTVTLSVPFTSGRNTFHVEWASGQLIVDVTGRWLPAARRTMIIGTGIVNAIRATRRGNGMRIVFDLTRSADLRTNLTPGNLILTIFPKGGNPMMGMTPPSYGVPGALPTPRAPGAASMPGYTSPSSGSPNVRPTRRPVPDYGGFPTSRITPVPSYAYPSAPYPAAPYPAPYGAVPYPMPPAPTPMPYGTPPPMAVPTYAPTPFPTMAPMTPPPAGEPVFTPEPLPSEAPFGDGLQAESTIFGSRAYGGLDLPLSYTESYPNGSSDTSISLIPGGTFGADVMFTPNIGMSLKGGAMSYTIKDAAAEEAGLQIRHRRDDYTGGLGLRLRFPIDSTLEAMGDVGGMVRTTQVTNTQAPIVDGTAGTSAPLTGIDDYLSTGWLGYGPALGFGFGWRPVNMFALAATGELDYVLGSMSKSTVTSIFPLIGIKAGLDARLMFGSFGMNAGYNFTTFSNGSASLSQTWHGPVLKFNFLF